MLVSISEEPFCPLSASFFLVPINQHFCRGMWPLRITLCVTLEKPHHHDRTVLTETSKRDRKFSFAFSRSGRILNALPFTVPLAFLLSPLCHPSWSGLVGVMA